jgi:hypothetical protein
MTKDLLKQHHTMIFLRPNPDTAIEGSASLLVKLAILTACQTPYALNSNHKRKEGASNPVQKMFSWTTKT